jgi:DNA-binding SARP family transcriptional activator
MPPALHLRVLGTAGLWAEGEGGEHPILGPGKPLALVAYLALAPQRSETREHLVDLLWADAEPEAARRNLRQSLYQVRRLLGDECISGDHDRLALACPVRVDRDEFLAAIDAGDLRRAVDLYAGPFFPAFAAPGGAGFEHWADLERQHLHAAFLRALEALGREAIARHRVRDGIALARRLRDAAPERESGWRLLLEALVTVGDWVQAATEAETCETLLRDLERTPEPATAALLRAARQAPSPAAAAEARLIVEMVGREAEFATVISAWEGAAKGRLRHVHILGTAGIGKTRLLRDVAARIAATGARVVHVRANQGERNLSYAVAGDLTRQLAALPGATGIAPATAGVLLGLDPALSARFPAARAAAADADELLRLRAMAVADLLAAVADERAVAVLVDDLHWTDAASRSVLAGLGARAAASPVLLVTTARPVADAAGTVRPEETVTLRPLTPDQVGQLMESAATLPEGLRAAGIVAAIHEAAAGSPLLVLNILQLAIDQGWLSRDAETWEGRDIGALLAQLRTGSALDRRLAGLGAHERRLLLSLAVAGAPVHDIVIEGMSRRFAFGATSTLHTLEVAGFVSRHGQAWETAHDLVAEQVLEGATRDELRAARNALGSALLDDAGEDEDRLRGAARQLAAAAEQVALARTYHRYARARRKRGDTQGARAMARDLLGAEASTDAVNGLARTLPWQLRLTRPIWFGLGGVAALTAIIGVLLWLGQPVRLVIRQMPEAWDQFSETPWVIDVLDRTGRTARGVEDSVELLMVGDTLAFGLVGRRKAAVRDGRATFDSLSASPGRRARSTLGFRLPGLPVVFSDSFISGNRANVLRLDSGRLNGQVVTPARRQVNLAPGEILQGRLVLRLTAITGIASQVMAVVPQWGDRRTNLYNARAVPAHVINLAFEQRLAIAGPTRPGRYGLVLAYGMETEARFIAAGSNWAFGEPLWFDGNDLYDLTAAQRDSANRAGGLMRPWDLPTQQHPTQQLNTWSEAMPVANGRVGTRFRERHPRWVPMTTLEIVVR